MKRSIKRGIWIAVLVLVLLLAVPIGLVVSAFIGLKPLTAREFGSDSVVKDGFVAVGVIDEGNGKVALIDAGKDETGKEILGELARRHLDRDAVTDIFLTHGHSDHDAAARLFPGAAVHIGAADIALATGQGGSEGPLTKFGPKNDAQIKNLVGFSGEPEFPIGAKSVRAFSIPGHTQGSAAYLVDGLLFLGDSASCMRDGKLRPAPYAMSDSQAQNLASLRALASDLRAKNLSVRQLVCAHSGALEGVGPLSELAAGSQPTRP